MLLLIQESKSRRFLTKFGLIPSNVFFRLGSAQSKLGVYSVLQCTRVNILREALKKNAESLVFTKVGVPPSPGWVNFSSSFFPDCDMTKIMFYTLPKKISL